MTITPKDITDARRDAAAFVMLEYALNPMRSAAIANHLGYKARTYTREDVASAFGKEAADAWQRIIDARQEFVRLTKSAEGGEHE